MSRSDAVQLSYGQVKKAIEDPSIRFYKIDVYRGKEDVEYETWLGPNALESLRTLFRVRRRRGERVTDESPIFSTIGGDRPLQSQSLYRYLKRLGDKVNITISPHRIRKFFETYITTGGVHPLTAKYWMGHQVSGGTDVEASYIIPPQNVQR